MGSNSNFKDLDATSTTVKTDRDLNKRFARYFFFCIRFYEIKENKPTKPLSHPGLRPHATSGALRFIRGWESFPQHVTCHVG